MPQVARLSSKLALGGRKYNSTPTVNLNLIIVAGGGGGSAGYLSFSTGNRAGGGGGGAGINLTTYTATPGTTYTITVGGGGPGGYSIGYSGGNFVSTNGSPGGNSFFGGVEPPAPGAGGGEGFQSVLYLARQRLQHHQRRAGLKDAGRADHISDDWY